MKENLKKIFFVFLCLMFVGYLLVTGVSDLINTKDIHTVNIDGCTELLEIEHTINGLIPIGKEHYYFAYDYEGNSACIIKAQKSWYKKNFDESGKANADNGLTVTVLAKKISDLDISREIYSRISAVENVNYSVDPGYALDIDYMLNAIEKLVLLLVGLVLAVLVYVVSKRSKEDNNVLGKIVAVLAIVFLFLVLKVIV